MEGPAPIVFPRHVSASFTIRAAIATKARTLPKGKTNALNVDLGAPVDWSLEEAIAAYSSGRRIVRRPLAISREGDDGPAMLGFIIGAGAFTHGVDAGQDAHSLGFFNSLAVGAASVWGILRCLIPDMVTLTVAAFFWRLR